MLVVCVEQASAYRIGHAFEVIIRIKAIILNLINKNLNKKR
ncbi:hypothetical protein MY4824_007776 [Beauveria thailandica]